MAESNPFSVCFNMLKLKYATYDASISALNRLVPTDAINIFLNIETILKYLSTITDLEKKLCLFRDYKISMTSDLINVAAHYKEFFKGNGLDTKVFLYMTDLSSEDTNFPQSKHNIDYRCYYLNKYKGNPKYIELTEAFRKFILPKAKIICDFVPDVYLIQGKNIDGSLIPFIIGEHFPERKNFIVSADIYETQYEFLSKYTHHLYKRHYANTSLSCTIPEFLKEITRQEELSKEEKELYNHQGFYTLLLACRGEKYRSIDKVSGLGYKTLTKKIIDGLNRSIITEDTKSIELLSRLFDGQEKDEIIENYQAISLEDAISSLTEGSKNLIVEQIIDRSDLNSLMKLNQTMFTEYPLRIESLLK